MSDIRNPITCRTFKQVDNTLAEILVDAGLMEYNRDAVQPSAVPRPTQNVFAVGRTQWGKLSIVLTTPSGAVSHFGGDPAQARTAFQTMAWSAAAQAQILQGPEVPEAIIKQYADEYKYERAVKNATANKINEAGAR